MNKVKVNDDGSAVEVTPQTLEEWRFIGMTNLCFIETGFYKGLENR